MPVAQFRGHRASESREEPGGNGQIQREPPKAGQAELVAFSVLPPSYIIMLTSAIPCSTIRTVH